MSTGGRRPGLLPNLSLLAFSLGLCFALDLALGRLLEPATVAGMRRPDAVYHHGLVANRQGSLRWGGRTYPFATNSLGFRDFAPREVPLRTDGHRVVFIGDSFTEGIGVAYPETFTGRLARRLAPAGIEVLNAGVIGYGPKLYKRKVRQLVEARGLEFDALFVMLDNSDVPNAIVYAGWGAPRPPLERGWESLQRWLRTHSFAARALFRLAERERRIAWNASGMPFADDLDNSYFDDPEFLTDGHWDETYAYAERGLALASGHMSELAALCRRHGIAMTIVVYPWPRNIELGERNHVQVEYWRRFSAAQDVAFVDLYALFIPEPDADAIVDVGDPAGLFIEGDVHWNAQGHRAVADALEPVVRDSLPLPDSTSS
jgi:lysophospholipase L1-like esterase